MAIVLEANYAKKLGLPNYSSHQYSVTIRTELTDLSQVEAESARLYRVLQDAVDHEIQEVGFMPDATTYGMINGNGRQANGNVGHANGNGHPRPQNGSIPPGKTNGEPWCCTDGQKGLILRVINENNLDKQEIEELAQQLFGVGVKQLDKMQASQLIEELLEKIGKPAQRSRWRGQPQRARQ